MNELGGESIRHYKHTQTGYWLIIALVILLSLTVFLMVIYGFNWILFTVTIIFALCLILFPTLTVEIYGDNIEIRFGPGVVRKKFSLKDLESYQIVKNPWYYGWGIRLTPHGWLYNLSGLLAIELQMKSGKKYRIGIDEPKKLAKAIQQSLNKL